MRFAGLLRRDLLLARRRGTEWVVPLAFFAAVCSLFPLGVGPEPAKLRVLAPGVTWIAALLAGLLATDSLFREDFHDGALDQMLLSDRPLLELVLAKVLAHWLVTGVPLALLSPLTGLLLNLPAHALPVLGAGLMLGTACLSLLGAIGAALTVALGRGGLLMAFLVMPLYVPVLVFGVSAAGRAATGQPWQGPLLVLAGLTLLALALAPVAVAAGLRASVEE